MVVTKIGSVAQICMVAREDRIIDLARLRQQSPTVITMFIWFLDADRLQ